MIGYTDVAMVRFMRGLFTEQITDPKITLCWRPSDKAREGLAAEPKEGEKEQESIGIPGLAIYRTNVEKDLSRFNMPMAAVGIDQGTLVDPDPDNPSPVGVSLRVIPVAVTYEIMVWTRHLSDRNLIERELMFADIYKVLNLKVETYKDVVTKVNPETEPGLLLEKEFTFISGPQTYDEEWNDETGNSVWYGLHKEYIVFSELVKSVLVPRITSIITTYNEIVSGNPIDDVLLDTIIVEPH